MLILQESLFFLGCRLGLLLKSLSNFISNNIRQKTTPGRGSGLLQSTTLWGTTALLVASLVKGVSISSLSASNFLLTPSALCKLRGLLGEAGQIYCTRLCLAELLAAAFLAMQGYRYCPDNTGFTQKDQ